MANYDEQNIKEGIDGHAARWYSDVFNLVFPDVDYDRANNLWKLQMAKPAKDDAELQDEE